MLSLVSCNEFQRALRTDKVEPKVELATKLYAKNNYGKVIRLLEIVESDFKGKPEGEPVFYMYAQSLFKTKQYYLASYQFEKYVAAYPKSEHVEEAAYLGAKCYSMLSPSYSLDQTDTYKAIEKLQEFVDAYPNSSYLNEANEIVKNLRFKLEKKAYENAIQYNTIMDYKSALVALDNFIIDFPGTTLKEDALFYRLDSAYKLAINSVANKKEERMTVAKVAFANYAKSSNNKTYKEKAEAMNSQIEKELQQFQIKQ